MLRKTSMLTGVLLATIFAAAVVRAATTYTFATLQYPSSNQTYATGINSAGVVVGYYFDTTGTAHGFVYQGSTFGTFDIPKAGGTWITGVNDSDTIVGYFTYALNGISLDIGFELHLIDFTKIEASKSLDTFPTGINNSDTITGYSEVGLTNFTAKGFTYSSGTFTTVSVNKQANTWVTGLNNSGQVVGYAGAGTLKTDTLEGFVQQNGQITTVSYPGATQTVFSGINDPGAIVGYESGTSGIPTGFVYQGGTFTQILDSQATTLVPQRFLGL
jgi:probable HAF family extracellular repeat protein